MIETKTFTGPIVRQQGSIYPMVTLDEKVNAFLDKNRVELIDIKFSVAAIGENLAAAAMIVYSRERHEGEL